MAAGSEFEPIARVLAVRTGLPLCAIAANDISSFLRSKHHSATTFVGAPSVLSAATVREIAARSRVPWTIVTGYDAPAASFVVAKLLALRSTCATPAAWIVMDAIEDRAVRILPSGSTINLGALEVGLLEAGYGSGLIVHAHGDGAHADLKKVVLCGVVDDVERTPLGTQVQGGCCYREDGAFCKRRGERHECIVPFHALRASHFVHLSCNGYSPTGESYLSNVSVALSSLDGYASEIVTSLRPLNYPSSLPIVLGRIAAAEHCLASVAHVVSDLMRRQGFYDSIVRIGAIAEPRFPQNPDTVAALNSLGVHLLRPLPDRAIVQIQGAVVRGQDLVIMSGRPARTSPSQTDATTQVIGCEARLKDLGALVDRGRRWERALSVSIASTSYSEQAEAAMSDLLEASHQLDNARELAENEVIESRDTGLIQPRLAAALDLIDIMTMNWDAAFVRVLRSQRDDQHPFYLYHRGWREPPLETSESCDRCTARIESTALRLPFIPNGNARISSCPNCGDRDFLWDGEGELHVEVPRQVAPGNILRIAVRRVPQDKQRHPVPAAWVLTHVRDKADGPPMGRRLRKVVTGAAMIAFRVPDTCPPDLHSVKMTWVEGLRILVARRRFACVPKV